MNKQNSTFETLKFSPYDSENLLLDSNSDPDENFFKESYFADTNYFLAEEAKLKYLVVRAVHSHYFILTLEVSKKTLRS